MHRGWVTVADAAQLARRPPKTVRTWIGRRVTAACRVSDHAVVVWFPDLYDATFEAGRRLRRVA